MKNSTIIRYYAQVLENKTTHEKILERLKHDPIRLYEGTNENISLRPIKGLKIG